MAAGKFDGDILHLNAAVGAGISGKVQEAIEANPYRSISRPPPTPEEEKRESRRAMRMMVQGLKSMQRN